MATGQRAESESRRTPTRLYSRSHFGDVLPEGSLTELDDPISVLNDLYIRFNREAETHPELEAEARDWFRRLEAGDPVARDRWTRIRAASLHRFDGLYERLGVRFEEVIGESFFEDRMQPILDELEDKGLLQESDDARVVFLEEWDMPPMLLTKTDGATLYSTRDLAAAEFRWQSWHFESCMYVVDAGQSLHFRQLFQVLRLLGREYADRMEHLEFGILRLPVDGRWARGKSRKGQVVLLEDVLDRARDLAREQILAKNPELENIDEIAEAIGIASVVFSDMKAKRNKDVNFDLQQITSFEGETGAYLQYTHARFCGIERKYAGDLTATADYGLLTTPEELALLKQMAGYPAMVERAAAEREPSIISQYLLGLGSLFNTYYEAHKINVPEANLARTRVALVQALRTVLANGLAILGIRPLERM